MNQDLTWIATTQTSQWQSKEVATTSLASECKWDVEAQLAKPLQTIDGFGACFNELGWTSLSTLADEDRGAIFRGTIRIRRRSEPQYLPNARGC
jgi:glucosylceramidase